MSSVQIIAALVEFIAVAVSATFRNDTGYLSKPVAGKVGIISLSTFLEEHKTILFIWGGFSVAMPPEDCHLETKFFSYLFWCDSQRHLKLLCLFPGGG